MQKSYSLLLTCFTLVLLPCEIQAQWMFQGVFPDNSFEVGIFGGQGIAVDPEGKVWFQPFGPTESVQVLGLNNTSQPTHAIYVFHPDGTPASFSPIVFVDLPGGERDTLGGFLATNANGIKEWQGKSGQGLRTDYEGNILVSQFSHLYKLDYQTGTGLAHINTSAFVDSRGLTAPTVDANGHVYVSGVFPGDPIAIFDTDLNFLRNAIDVTRGFSHSFEVTPDGRTLFWSGYTNHAVVVYQRPDTSSPFDSLGITLEGFDSESLTLNRTTGNLWLSAGSLNDRPNRFPGVATNWLPQTWYGFTLDDILARDGIYTPLAPLSWSPDGLEGRPRGLAFSPDGQTAYATQFIQPFRPIQVFSLDAGGVAIEPHDVVPTQFTLSQNYPNPFSDATAIPFHLDQPAQVSLRIYNTLGQEIATLLDGVFRPTGQHEVVWDSRYPNGKLVINGTYFYTLTHAGHHHTTHTMTLIR